METPVTQDLVDAFINPGPQLEALLPQLPIDLLYKIVEEYLPSYNIVHLCEVSRYFREKLCARQRIWKHLYQQDISELRPPLIPEGATTPDWRTAYINIINATRILPQRQLLDMLAENGYEKLLASETKRVTISEPRRTMMARMATRKCYLDIIDQILLLGVIDVNQVMADASRNGCRSIVNKMLELGANNFNDALQYAAEGGHRAIVDQMIELGADDLNRALAYAAGHGQADMVDYLISRGADDLNHALNYALWGLHFDVADLLLELGATNLNEALSTTHPHNLRKITEYIKSRTGKLP